MGKYFYLPSLTLERKEQFNQEYLKQAEAALASQNTVLIVAPYGGVAWFGKTIKRGVLGLMEKAKFYCLSFSKVFPHNPPNFSAIMTPKKGENYEDFFLNEFKLLRAV